MPANDELANHRRCARSRDVAAGTVARPLRSGRVPGVVCAGCLCGPRGASHGDAAQVFVSPGAAEQQAAMGMDPTQAQVRSLAHATGKASHEA